MLLRATALAGLAVIAAACGSGADDEGTTTSALPPGCSVREVDTIVTRFLRRPDLAPREFFEVVSFAESDGRRFSTRTRAQALAELRRLRADGERQRLVALSVAPQDINRVTISFDLTRFSRALGARGITTRLASGTGTVDCAHGKVAAWRVRGP